jgi:two-component system, NtrC family, response regulator AtoC
MPKERVLVVDDDPAIRYTLSEALRAWGYEPLDARTIAAALEAFDADQPAAVLQDINLPDGSGLDALIEYKKRQPQAIVIIITGDVNLDATIAALRGGAYDFISKPIRLGELQVTIRNGIEAGRLRREVRYLRHHQEKRLSFDQIVGTSRSMNEMITLARKISASEASSVLLIGESGTGKDVVAKAIHYGSPRADQPFVAINCAAIPGTLIESELFGHEKGAFTDARARKEGLFEQAQGGTFFLDEIFSLELGLQAKLLRVLEDGTFRRVGGLKDLPLDVRIIAASNRDLRLESEAGRFRSDLYYRLSVIEIDLPPLRDRGEDVLLLANHYVAHFNERLKKRIRNLTPEVEDVFRRYPWPGNVRELRNVIERLMILEDSDSITATWLPRDLMKRDQAVTTPTVAPAAKTIAVPPPSLRLPDGGIDLEQLELELVRQALERSGGNQTRASELLGISRDQLRYRLKKIEDSLAQ